MKTAIVYDRINKWGGAERVLLALHELFPEAPIYTSVYDPKKAPWAKVFPKVITSFIQEIPILRRAHEVFGWLTPIAFEQFDFSEYDLVVSVTSEAAKGIITKPGTKHVCYCLTPTRYLWSGYGEYQKNRQWPFNLLPFYNLFSKPILNYLRKWDKVAAERPDEIIAISREVQRRILKYYQRKADVIYPPLTFKNKKDNFSQKEYYLLVGRLIPYKKVGLAIEAFNKLKKPLVIVGEGSEERSLKRKAGKTIKFFGRLKDNELSTVYAKAKALILPQEEDFGLVSLEAQASGVPVIAFKKGGALETVIDGKTGLYFESQTVDSITKAVVKFEKKRFKEQDLITNAGKFSKKVFAKGILSIINK